MKSLVPILLPVIGILFAQPGTARDLVDSRSVVEDASGTMTIAEVARLAGTPAGPNLAIGATVSAYWLRLKVQAPDHGREVVLFILPTFVNEVRLYEADSGDPSHWKTRVTGNHYPYGRRDRAGIPLGFVVTPATPVGTYYLRVKTRSPLSLNVEALEPEEANRKEHQRDLIAVFFATSMAFLLIWAIHSYVLDRHPVVGLFAIHQAVYTMFGIVATGYLAPLAPAAFPQLLDWINVVLYLAINFTCLLFCREVFKVYAPPPVLMRGLNLLLCTFPLLLAALAMGHDVFAVTANAAAIKITWVYFVIVAFSTREESAPSRRTLRVLFVSILMNNLAFWYASRIASITSMVHVGAVETLVFDGLFIGGLFALMLHVRMRHVMRKAQQAAMDLLLIQRKFELERELKKQIEVQAQTDYLTGLSNRRRCVELAELELTRAIRFQRPFTLLLIDIDHFKAINDTWGHSAGDVVLQKVSFLIRETLRSNDILGRIGGEEFAAVLVETEGQDAIAIAQRLCTSVADAVIVPPDSGRVPVSISIGLTELKGRNPDFNTLLREADRAMYRAKQAGRNQAVINRMTATGAK